MIFFVSKGSGKTHTLSGSEQENEKGIIPRMFEDLFDLLSHPENGDYKINSSLMSIYNETLIDLLSR